jgi:hypothetical protein
MRFQTLLIASLIFIASGVDNSFAETQTSGAKAAQSAMKQSSNEKMQQEKAAQKEKINSKNTSAEMNNSKESEAMARLKIEDQSAGEADADLAQDSMNKGKSDSRPRFGVNRQLDMRNSSQMRGR